jgi:hypothetical protein
MPAAPDIGIVAHQPDEGFIHQLGRLPGMGTGFAPQLNRSQPAQLGVDQWSEFSQSGWIAAPPTPQVAGYLSCTLVLFG